MQQTIPHCRRHGPTHSVRGTCLLLFKAPTKAIERQWRFHPRSQSIPQAKTPPAHGKDLPKKFGCKTVASWSQSIPPTNSTTGHPLAPAIFRAWPNHQAALITGCSLLAFRLWPLAPTSTSSSHSQPDEHSRPWVYPSSRAARQSSNPSANRSIFAEQSSQLCCCAVPRDFRNRTTGLSPTRPYLLVD